MKEFWYCLLNEPVLIFLFILFFMPNYPFKSNSVCKGNRKQSSLLVVPWLDRTKTWQPLCGSLVIHTALVEERKFQLPFSLDIITLPNASIVIVVHQTLRLRCNIFQLSFLASLDCMWHLLCCVSLDTATVI